MLQALKGFCLTSNDYMLKMYLMLSYLFCSYGNILLFTTYKHL